MTFGLAQAAGATGATPEAPAAAPSRRGLSPWASFAVRRLGGVVLSLAILVVVTFVMIPLIPGDPAVVIAGPDATGAQISALRQELGLNDPLGVQFVHYLGNIFTGDLGDSFVYHQSVLSIIAIKLPFTAEIALYGILLVLLLAVPLGMVVGVLTRGGRARWLDVTFGVVTGFVQSVPQYVMGTVLVVIFAIALRMLPAAGAQTPQSVVLPVVGLAFGPICGVARLVRRETATVLEQDYIRTAKGHRLRAVRLYAVHALPNLLTTTLTLAGLILTGMLGSAIIMENVFNWPGLGREIVSAIVSKDYPVIQGILLTLGALAVLLNLLVDVILGIIDPRTLTGRGTGV